MATNHTINVTIEVSSQTIEDWLCPEYSSYWGRFGLLEGKPFSHGFRYQVCDDQTGLPEKDESGKPIPYAVVTAEGIKKGLQVMASKYPRHFADLVSENGDADTGDVLFQCCAFGEIVYG